MPESALQYVAENVLNPPASLIAIARGGRGDGPRPDYCTTSDATYGLTTYTYDALGRTTQVTEPDGSTLLTSYAGRATEVQDEGNGAQRVTRISQVDGLGRLTSVCEVASGPFVGGLPTLTACLISDTACHFSCEHWFFAAYCPVSRRIAKNT